MSPLTNAFTRLSSGRLSGAAAAGMRRVVRALTARPERVLSLLRVAPVRSDTGATLDLQLQVLVAVAHRIGHPDVNQLTPEQARAQMRMDARGVAPDPVPLAHTEDLTFPGPQTRLRARLYAANSRPNQPGIVYFHGGGWVVGDIESHDASCRVLAHRARCSVVSVEYRLAPEHPFPAAVLDADAAFRWVVEHAVELGLDPSRIGVAGDSAGGNLAAVVCLRARDAGTPVPAIAVLIYPGTDMTMSRPSQRTFERGFFLERPQIEWYRGHYVKDPDDWTNPDASPIFARNVAGLPRTLLVTAGFDPLRDEGRDYAKRLEDAGVAVTYCCYDQLLHGFKTMAGASRAAAAASDEIADYVRNALSLES